LKATAGFRTPANNRLQRTVRCCRINSYLISDTPSNDPLMTRSPAAGVPCRQRDSCSSLPRRKPFPTIPTLPTPLNPPRRPPSGIHDRHVPAVAPRTAHSQAIVRLPFWPHVNRLLCTSANHTRLRFRPAERASWAGRRVLRFAASNNLPWRWPSETVRRNSGRRWP
jgi:hypothetical protein